MPANTCNIYDINFFAIRLLGYFTDSDTIFFREFFFEDHIPEFCYAAYPHTQHKVLCKAALIITLKNKPAAISFKAGIVTHIPINRKAKFYEKLF